MASESKLDTDRFGKIVERHEGRLRAFIATMVAFDPDAIDEVLQATWLTAWKKLDTFRHTKTEPDEEAISWMCSIARYETFSHLRRESKQRRFLFSEELINQIVELQSEESDYFEARRRALDSCVDKLAPKHRESIRLRYGMGLSMAEVAAIEGKQVNAATVGMARLRKSLERCVQLTLSREGQK